MDHFARFLVVIVVLYAPSWGQEAALPGFEEYAIEVYSGSIVAPGWIKKSKDGAWRDDLGKMASEPHVNFAGVYYLSAHSCGTGCRYYSLTDLRTGKELEILGGFASAEPPPRTRGGHTYISILHSRADSTLLVVQYLVQKPNAVECRERSFVLSAARLRPVTPTLYECREF